MKLISAFALAAMKETELHALYSRIAGKLPRTKRGSIEEANALGSLENITRELVARKVHRPKP